MEILKLQWTAIGVDMFFPTIPKLTPNLTSSHHLKLENNNWIYHFRTIKLCYPQTPEQVIPLVDWHKLTYLVLTCRKTPISQCSKDFGSTTCCSIVVHIYEQKSIPICTSYNNSAPFLIAVNAFLSNSHISEAAASIYMCDILLDMLLHDLSPVIASHYDSCFSCYCLFNCQLFHIFFFSYCH